ncbi:hypothetical protein Droror1_Dr00016326 [Drosera rotundifolia]
MLELSMVCARRYHELATSPKLSMVWSSAKRRSATLVRRSAFCLKVGVCSKVGVCLKLGSARSSAIHHAWRPPCAKQIPLLGSARMEARWRRTAQGWRRSCGGRRGGQRRRGEETEKCRNTTKERQLEMEKHSGARKEKTHERCFRFTLEGSGQRVLLGDMGTGKTSLVLRFVKGQFFDHQEPTIGAAFFSQILSLNEATIKFDIWDTAGQERYHSLAPMYYREAAAAVVVYDIANMDSFVRAKKWVEEL